MNWWPFYRAAWCFNNLDLHDSAEVYASAALALSPGNESCLAELLEALADSPERVLEHSLLVSGGGVCRYRLARAEMQTGCPVCPSVLWLLEAYGSDDPQAAADAGCWLSILFPDRGLEYIERAVELMPASQFYRCLLVERLIDSGQTLRAEAEFGVLQETADRDLSFWQTAASLHEAMGDGPAALEDSRRAFMMRSTPSTGADLGWRLYFLGRDLVREGRIPEALPYLMECSGTWSGDSSWALRADSLIDLTNSFTSISDGFCEPL